MSFEGGIRVCGHFEAAWPRARSRSNFAHTNARHTASLYEDLGTYQMIVGDRRVLSDNYIAPMGR